MSEGFDATSCDVSMSAVTPLCSRGAKVSTTLNIRSTLSRSSCLFICLFVFFLGGGLRTRALQGHFVPMPTIL